eukprot:710711-Pelagomonas_calceolata.AAC.1
MVLLACSVFNSAALFCLQFQSHWAASVPGVFGGRRHGECFWVLATSGPPAPGLWGLGGVQG